MIKTYHQYDLSGRNTFRMRVRCALYVELTEEADLPALDWDALPQPVMVMGGGSNLLFTGDFPGTVLHFAAGAGVSLNEWGRVDQVQGNSDRGVDQVQGISGRGPISGAGPGPASVASTCLEGNIGGPGPGDESGPGPKSGWTRSNGNEWQVTLPAGVAKSAEGSACSSCEVTLPAGVVFDDFCAWAAAEGLWGPENLSLIPGEVGASAVQNIGAYGVEAQDIIAGIRAWDRLERRFVDIDPADCAYGYRTSRFKTDWKNRYVITAVTYRLSVTPVPKLDYGGIRKALAARGVDQVQGITARGVDQVQGITARGVDQVQGNSDRGVDQVQGISGRGPISGAGPGPASVASTCLEGNIGGPGPGDKSGPGPKTPLTPQLIRDTIIEIRRKKLPDPAEIGSAGSFFCNPVISREHFERIVATARQDNGPDYQVPHYAVGDRIKVPAAWMIEQCGFKGARNGGAQVYPGQPLVIVNASGSATPEEIIGLEQRIIGTIADKYGITLHPEVEHLPGNSL